MVKLSLIPALRRADGSITRRHPAVAGGLRATLLALFAVVLFAQYAAAAPGPSLSKSPLLWATVNICDTPEHPDTIGVRGSMPGSGVKAERMFMRFQLEFFDQTDKSWQPVGAASDPGFVPVGSGRFKQRQSGRNFTVRPPRTGAFILRGVVRFEWRRGGEVVRSASVRTTSKRGPTAGADPIGFSAATCEVRA